MGVIEFMFAVIGIVTLGIVSIPLYAMYRGYNQSDEKIKLKKIQEEKKLEELKQENFLLENKQMQLELDQIKEERETREQQTLEDAEHQRWLIEDSKDERRRG
jgi:isopropylmalate/homocitrate/citramalate synthase